MQPASSRPRRRWDFRIRPRGRSSRGASRPTVAARLRRRARSAIGSAGATPTSWSRLERGPAPTTPSRSPRATRSRPPPPPARAPRLRFLLLGDGVEAPAVERALAEPLARGEVVCPGLLPEPAVRAYVEAADVYWSTVPSDGTSISLLEAMALERPPVIVDAFGNREWVEPGRTGWLVRGGDAPAAAAALLDAFADDDRRRRMGAAAREVVLARARWEDNVERLIDLYAAVAS